MLVQSKTAIAVTMHKVKLLNNFAAIDCIWSYTLQPTFGLILTLKDFILLTNLQNGNDTENSNLSHET